MSSESVKKSKWVDCRRCLLCQTRGNMTTLFRFPPRPDIKKKWASFCNMDPDFLTTKDCLCINHFAPDQVIPKLPTSKKTKLRLTAVPCFMNNNLNQVMNESTVKTVKSANSRPIQSKNSTHSVKSENSNHPTQSENSNHPTQSKNSTHSVESENSNHPARSPTFIDAESCNDFVPQTEESMIVAPPELLSESESTISDLIDSENEESLVEYEKITIINVTPRRKSAAKKTVRYIGDVTDDHLKSHENAVKYFSMAKTALAESKRKVHALRHQVARFQKKVKKYEEIISKLKKERRGDSVSDDDFTWPLEEEEEEERYDIEV